jgi:hypothetical protein
MTKSGKIAALTRPVRGNSKDRSWQGNKATRQKCADLGPDHRQQKAQLSQMRGKLFPQLPLFGAVWSGISAYGRSLWKDVPGGVRSGFKRGHGAAALTLKGNTMTRLMIALGMVAGMAAVPALAQDLPTDADGNGTWSMEELQATYPNLSEEVFAAMDTSADGQIDTAEFEAAMGANLLTQ